MSHDTETLTGEGKPAARRLWSGNFKLYLTARSASMLGDAMLPVALSIGVLAAGYGIDGVGYSLGAWMGALALFMLFGGVLADRFTPRRMMIIADLVRLVVQSAMAVAFALGTPSLTAIIVLQFLSGAATSLFQPGVASMVPQVSDDVQGANGILRISEAISGVLGPALAGVLVSVAGAGTVFGIYAATYGVSAICLFALRLSPAEAAESSEPTFWRQLVEGWREFAARRWLWGVIVIHLVFGCFVAGVSLPVGADLVTSDYGSTALGIGMAAFGAGGVVGGALAMKVRPSRPLRSGAIGWALFALYPITPAVGLSVAMLIVGWTLAGFGLAYWGVLWSTTVQTQIPAELLNRVYAYDVSGSLLSLVFGRSLAGPMASLLGARPLMILATVLGFACTLVLLAVRSIRDLRSADEPTSE
ncbi:MFS transporter [Amycolatopsis sp. SID8362]|uniref:MFS transporter n=1 Tax=Amycolatopsis sp. SID8362 TaxID=2690346 RepID=UPI001369E0C7|nr:MFS transporter [Amycolatopsis sp. SID8362]NBH03197.1 MFS transporter [Amycolatopsis sp. SID8362]NED39898.1 MFS transporter [Amycolatopsis sp. SID8362]